jgi:hypothetical protein
MTACSFLIRSRLAASELHDSDPLEALLQLIPFNLLAPEFGI